LRPFSRDSKDFRFQYALYASGFYYSISLILLYIIHRVLRFSNSSDLVGSISSLDLIYFIGVSLLFCIFRLATPELGQYFEGKNLNPTKEIKSVHELTSKNIKYKEEVLKEASKWEDLAKDGRTIRCTRNFINEIKFSSMEIDSNILKKCIEITGLLSEPTLEKEDVTKKITKLLS